MAVAMGQLASGYNSSGSAASAAGHLLCGLLAQGDQLLLGLVVGLGLDLALLLQLCNCLLVLPSDLQTSRSQQPGQQRENDRTQIPLPVCCALIPLPICCLPFEGAEHEMPQHWILQILWTGTLPPSYACIGQIKAQK